MIHWIRHTCWVLGAWMFVVSSSLSPALADPGVFEPGSDPAIGFNLIAWHNSANSTAWQNAVQSLYDSGFREVSISPVRRVDVTTGNITIASYPTLTAIDAGVVRAKQLGMRVTLNPFVELSNSQWRATLHRCRGARWPIPFWPQYESYLDEVATIAQNRGVEAMNVGTEMKGLDSFYNITDFDPGRQAIKARRRKRNWTSRKPIGIR